MCFGIVRMREMVIFDDVDVVIVMNVQLIACYLHYRILLWNWNSLQIGRGD